MQSGRKIEPYIISQGVELLGQYLLSERYNYNSI